MTGSTQRFGPRTRAALERYQAFVGLRSDGIAGPLTKKSVVRPRADGLADGKGETGDEATYGARAKAGQPVKYWVGSCPGGSLRREAVLEELADCFAQWAAATNGRLSFKRVEDPGTDEPDLVLSWGDRSGDQWRHASDGPGESGTDGRRKRAARRQDGCEADANSTLASTITPSDQQADNRPGA